MWTNQMQETLNSKKKGDIAFRHKEFTAAIDCYTQIETEKLLAHLVEEEMNKRMAMMTVKRNDSGPGFAFKGKPSVHPAIVDLKGKAYEWPGIGGLGKIACVTMRRIGTAPSDFF